MSRGTSDTALLWWHLGPQPQDIPARSSLAVPTGNVEPTAKRNPVHVGWGIAPLRPAEVEGVYRSDDFTSFPYTKVHL